MDGDRRDGDLAAVVLPPVGDLANEERLLLDAYRRWLRGIARSDVAEWEWVWRHWSTRFGSDRARTVLAALEGLIRCLSGHAQRRIAYHPPCCGVLGADEVTLLRLVGAAQRDEAGRSRTIAAGLVSTAGIGDLVAAALRLGDALRSAGLHLPSRHWDSGLAAAAVDWCYGDRGTVH